MFAEPFARNLLGDPGRKFMVKMMLMKEFKTGNLRFIDNLKKNQRTTPAQLSSDRGYPERSSKHDKTLLFSG